MKKELDPEPEPDPEPVPDPDPDPLVRGADPGIWIRIRTKMSRILTLDFWITYGLL
jgi:hypothetical protein